MGQHGKLRRQSHARERIGDVLLPGARAAQALAKTIRLSKLEANVIDCLEEALRGALRAPQIAHVLLFRRKRAGDGGDVPQHLRVVIVRGFDDPLALVRRRARREMQRFVDDREILIIVKEAGVGIDLRVHADPELHGRLKLGGTWHHIIRSTHRHRAEAHQSTGQKD